MNRMSVKSILGIGVMAVLSCVITTQGLAVTYLVPSEEQNINLALAHTDVTEVLVRSDYTETQTVHMKSGVPVRRDPASTVPGNPTVSVTNASAVIFPSETTSGTTLEGFDLESSGNFGTVDCDSAGNPAIASEIRDCTIVSNDWNAVTIGEHSVALSNCAISALYSGVLADSAGTSVTLEVRDCQIQTTSVGPAVSLEDHSGTIQGCRIEGGANALGVAIGGEGSGHSDVVEKCLLLGADTSNLGVLISAPHDTAIVRRNTLYATGQNGTGAIQVDRSSSVDNVLIEQNVIVGWGTGLECSLVNYMTVEHNLLYGNDENYGDCFFRPPDDLVDINPMWCDSAGGVFTLNLDSPCVASNNDYSVPIGALGVACAEGELTHGDVAITVDEMDPAGITVTSDVKISSGNSLTVGPGVTFKVDDSDEHNLGADSYENEMIIYGTLNVDGTSDAMVSFSSSKLSPGENDWRGLYFVGSSAFLDYAVVRNATYATVLSAPDTAAITNSLFESNGTFDIQIGGAGTDLSVLIEGNTLNVGGGDGIVVHDDGGNFGGYFLDNTLNGTSSSSNGIYIGDAIGDASPYLEGNVINGFSAGAGIRSDKAGSDPVLIRNVLSNNKWGLYFSNGNPTVGLSAATDTTSDNVCTGNTTAGMFFTGSSTTGTVRENRCTGNGTGISTKGNANPNLGSSGDSGYNILVPNTTYCLWNQSTSGTVSAQGNYLGGCSPPPSICWNGSFDLSNALCSVPSEASVLVEPVPRVQMLGPLPNPTRGGTVIRFNVGEENTRVAAAIFDVSGRLVKNLGEGNYEVGEHRLTWNGTGDSGYPVSSGLYFIRVSVNGVPGDVSRVLVTR